MIGKDQANQIADSMLSDARKARSPNSLFWLNFLYSPLLGKKILLEYTDRPHVVKKSILYAQSRWPFVIVVFVWLVTLAVTLYIASFLPALIVCCVACVALRQAIKYYALSYLNQLKSNA